MSEDTTSNIAQTTSAAIPSPVQAEVVTPPAAPDPAPAVAEPVVTATPEPTPAPVVTTPAVEPPAPVAKTVLGEDPSKIAPAAEPAADATPKEEPTPSDEPAQVASYENFVLPDGVAVEPEKLGKFTEILGEHKASQALGQQLVDLFAVEVKAVREAALAEAESSKAALVKQWGEQFEKDPEIGGNRKDTTVNAARSFISKYAGTPEQQTEFRQLMETTGLGNHPAVIRALSNANLALSEGKPLPARASATEVKSKTQIMYGKK